MSIRTLSEILQTRAAKFDHTKPLSLFVRAYGENKWSYYADASSEHEANSHADSIMKAGNDVRIIRSHPGLKFKRNPVHFKGVNIDANLQRRRTMHWTQGDKTIDAHDYVTSHMHEAIDPSAPQINELTRSDSAGSYIRDFMRSDNPRLKGKSVKDKQKMALGAYMAVRMARRKR